MITTKVSLQLVDQTVPAIIPVVQGDTGRSIIFEPSDFTIPEGATATYYIQKPSGEAVYNSAEITGNTVVCNLTAQSIIETGENNMQVRIILGEDIVTSFDAILMVRPFRGIGAVESETEINIFDKAVEQAEQEISDKADEIIAEKVPELEAIVEEVIESIPADYTALTNKVAAMLADMATEFSAEATYQPGDIVIYENDLYRKKNGPNITGEWIAAQWEAITLGSAIEQIVGNLAPQYDQTATYHKDDAVIYLGDLYICTSTLSVTGTWDASKWSKTDVSSLAPAVDATLTQQGKPADAKAVGDLFDAVVPQYSTQSLYARGDVVRFGEEVYTCIANEGEFIGGEFNPAKWDATTLYDALNDEITDVKADLNAKANVDGAYESMTVGNAEQLNSSQYAEDKTPYLFRASGGGVDVGTREEDTVVGGSIVWNQEIPINKINGTSTNSGVTRTNNGDGTCTFTGTATSNPTISMVGGTGGVPVVDGHKYIYNRLSFSDGAKYDTVIISNAASARICQSSYVKDITYNVTMPIERFDITAMFGSTIADYLYNLEQPTAGAGVALFRKLFPKPYYPYDAGTLKHVEGLTAHVMRDADENIIGNYPLDSTLTLRGIPKLDANNNIYFDGDTYEADGTVTRRYGVVDLGTLNWQYTGTEGHKRFNTSSVVSNMKGAASSVVANGICSAYRMTTNNDTYAHTADKTISLGETGYIYVYDTAYTDAAAFKTAMSGVYLVYELATPTTEEADPFATPQIVDEYGTEEYVIDDSITVPVPVGHVTKYPANLRKKIEGLPWDFSALIAPTEATYTATRAYTTGALFIVNNILYKATASIASGGTITPGTNCTATTLAEVISAL